ncbi:MAG: MBL fold metallo-hydrolase [Planctomycetaceae bacterium]|nr:MBL fold metallo-hydrolase [Planctomycetaceae bacterium]
MRENDASAAWTLLGTGTSMGVPMIGCRCSVCTSANVRNQRTRAGAAVRTAASAFLIDTPPELRLQLVREQIDHIEAIVFTHAHADHIMGLDDVRIFGYKLRGAVRLYCEAEVEAILRRTFSYAFDEAIADSLHSRPQLEFVRIGTEPFELAGVVVRPFRLMHGITPVLGFRIGNVAYATDCNAIPDESWPLLADLDVLVIDALWDEPHPTHFNVAQALEVIDRVKPRRAYLTHVSHRLDYEATNARLPPHVKLAHDGLQLP